MYKNKNAIATAGNTKPTVGTRIEGRKEAAIIIKFLLIWIAFPIVSELVS
jgi:hypothetical protein